MAREYFMNTRTLFTFAILVRYDHLKLFGLVWWPCNEKHLHFKDTCDYPGELGWLSW